MLKIKDIKVAAQIPRIKDDEIVQLERVGEAGGTIYYKDAQGALSEQKLFSFRWNTPGTS